MKVIAREVHTSLIRENKADPDMIRAAKRAESSSGVKGALTLAATEPEIAITPERLDAHPYLLNCRNGIVDLQAGDLLEHDPALLLTKMAGAPYEPDAEGAVFRDLLERISSSTGAGTPGDGNNSRVTGLSSIVGRSPPRCSSRPPGGPLWRVWLQPVRAVQQVAPFGEARG
jgi:hypothetical protein